MSRWKELEEVMEMILSPNSIVAPTEDRRWHRDSMDRPSRLDMRIFTKTADGRDFTAILSHDLHLSGEDAEEENGLAVRVGHKEIEFKGVPWDSCVAIEDMMFRANWEKKRSTTGCDSAAMEWFDRVAKTESTTLNGKDEDGEWTRKVPHTVTWKEGAAGSVTLQ